MKKNILSVLLTGVLAIGSFSLESVHVFADLKESLGFEGDVLNIYCFDEEAESLCIRYMPDYEKIGELEVSPSSSVRILTGRIGDTEVRWTIVTSGASEYESLLDDALLSYENMDSDRRVDLFMVSSSELAKYCDLEADVALNLNELGVESGEGEQFPVITGMAGSTGEDCRAVTWEVPCGAFVYRRSIAEDVFGTSDPEEIRSRVVNWDAFSGTAEVLKEAGYFILSSSIDTFEPSLSSDGAWVSEESRIVLSAKVLQWVEMNRMFAERGYFASCESIEDASKERLKSRRRFLSDPSIFGAFLTSEEAARMLGGSDESFGVCEGPEGFWASGNWLCAASFTDNRKLVRELLNTFTGNPEVMERITRDTGIITNHSEAMAGIASDPSYGSSVFGGQNDIEVFVNAALKCVPGESTSYDSTLKEIFLQNYSRYFSGECSESEALVAFYADSLLQYPDLLNG